MTSGLKDMWDAIPADIGIPKDVMDRARVALAYAQTQASEGETETAIAIIGKAIMAEREKCANVVKRNQELAELDASTLAQVGDRKGATAARITALVSGAIAQEICKGDA